MMRLPVFEYIAPKTVDEAISLLHKHGSDAKLLGGGTDLVVSLKQKLFEPKYVISLNSIDELKYVRFNPDDGIRIGAGMRLNEIAVHPIVREKYPALEESILSVATWIIQNMGTLGGNICLDTRCWYYNQSEFWRKSLGYCMKKGSEYCHVAPGLGKCVAVFSSDPVPMLIAYGASIKIVSPRGEKVIKLEDFYLDDGIKYMILESDEIVTEVQIPAPTQNTKAIHRKFRKRLAIDYPIVNCGIKLEIDSDHECREARICLGAVASAPLRMTNAEKVLTGQAITEHLIEKAAEEVYSTIKPLPNTAGTPGYRKKVGRVLVKRALKELVLGVNEWIRDPSGLHRS